MTIQQNWNRNDKVVWGRRKKYGAFLKEMEISLKFEALRDKQKLARLKDKERMIQAEVRKKKIKENGHNL